ARLGGSPPRCSLCRARGFEGPATMALTGDDGAGARRWACSRTGEEEAREVGRGEDLRVPTLSSGAREREDRERGINVFISISYALPQSLIDGKCSLSVREDGRDALGVAAGIEQRLPVSGGAGGEADRRSVAERRARRAGSEPHCGGVRARGASNGGPERVGPGDGGADRRDDLLAGGRKGEESGARGNAETARRAGAPNVPRGARSRAAIGRCGREVRERRARGRLLAEAAQGRVRLLGDGIGAASDRGLCCIRGGLGRGAGGWVCDARGGLPAVRRSARGGGALLRGGASLATAFDEAEAPHALCGPVWGRGGKVEVDEVGAAARRSGVAGVPDGAVAGEMGEELHHRDFRAVFGGETGEAIGALSRAASTADPDDDVGVG